MDPDNALRKNEKMTPEAQFRSTLDRCIRDKNLVATVFLYESNPSQTPTLNNINYFLYICFESLSDPETLKSAVEIEFNLFEDHNKDNFKPNEATITTLARLSAAKCDGDYAFELTKSVKSISVAPKLRTFVPSLICFCGGGVAEKAYEVEAHAESVGLRLEEPELAALLKIFKYCSTYSTSINKNKVNKIMKCGSNCVERLK